MLTILFPVLLALSAIDNDGIFKEKGNPSPPENLDIDPNDSPYMARAALNQFKSRSRRSIHNPATNRKKIENTNELDRKQLTMSERILDFRNLILERRNADREGWSKYLEYKIARQLNSLLNDLTLMNNTLHEKSYTITNKNVKGEKIQDQRQYTTKYTNKSSQTSSKPVTTNPRIRGHIAPQVKVTRNDLDETKIPGPPQHKIEYKAAATNLNESSAEYRGMITDKSKIEKIGQKPERVEMRKINNNRSRQRPRKIIYRGLRSDNPLLRGLSASNPKLTRKKLSIQKMLNHPQNRFESSVKQPPKVIGKDRIITTSYKRHETQRADNSKYKNGENKLLRADARISNYNKGSQKARKVIYKGPQSHNPSVKIFNAQKLIKKYLDKKKNLWRPKYRSENPTKQWSMEVLKQAKISAKHRNKNAERTDQSKYQENRQKLQEINLGLLNKNKSSQEPRKVIYRGLGENPWEKVVGPPKEKFGYFTEHPLTEFEDHPEDTAEYKEQNAEKTDNSTYKEGEKILLRINTGIENDSKSRPKPRQLTYGSPQSHNQSIKLSAPKVNLTSKNLDKGKKLGHSSYRIEGFAKLPLIRIAKGRNEKRGSHRPRKIIYKGLSQDPLVRAFTAPNVRGDFGVAKDFRQHQHGIERFDKQSPAHVLGLRKTNDKHQKLAIETTDESNDNEREQKLQTVDLKMLENRKVHVPTSNLVGKKKMKISPLQRDAKHKCLIESAEESQVHSKDEAEYSIPRHALRNGSNAAGTYDKPSKLILNGSISDKGKGEINMRRYSYTANKRVKRSSKFNKRRNLRRIKPIASSIFRKKITKAVEKRKRAAKYHQHRNKVSGNLRFRNSSNQRNNIKGDINKSADKIGRQSKSVNWQKLKRRGMQYSRIPVTRSLIKPKRRYHRRRGKAIASHQLPQRISFRNRGGTGIKHMKRFGNTIGNKNNHKFRRINSKISKPKELTRLSNVNNVARPKRYIRKRAINQSVINTISSPKYAQDDENIKQMGAPTNEHLRKKVVKVNTRWRRESPHHKRKIKNSTNKENKQSGSKRFNSNKRKFQNLNSKKSLGKKKPKKYKKTSNEKLTKSKNKKGRAIQSGGVVKRIERDFKEGSKHQKDYRKKHKSNSIERGNAERRTDNMKDVKEAKDNKQGAKNVDGKGNKRKEKKYGPSQPSPKGFTPHTSPRRKDKSNTRQLAELVTRINNIKDNQQAKKDRKEKKEKSATNQLVSSGSKPQKYSQNKDKINTKTKEKDARNQPILKDSKPQNQSKSHNIPTRENKLGAKAIEPVSKGSKPQEHSHNKSKNDIKTRYIQTIMNKHDAKSIDKKPVSKSQTKTHASQMNNKEKAKIYQKLKSKHRGSVTSFVSTPQPLDGDQTTVKNNMENRKKTASVNDSKDGEIFKSQNVITSKENLKIPVNVLSKKVMNSNEKEQIMPNSISLLNKNPLISAPKGNEYGNTTKINQTTSANYDIASNAINTKDRANVQKLETLENEKVKDPIPSSTNKNISLPVAKMNISDSKNNQSLIKEDTDLSIPKSVDIAEGSNSEKSDNEISLRMDNYDEISAEIEDNATENKNNGTVYNMQHQEVNNMTRESVTSRNTSSQIPNEVNDEANSTIEDIIANPKEQLFDNSTNKSNLLNLTLSKEAVNNTLGNNITKDVQINNPGYSYNNTKDSYQEINNTNKWNILQNQTMDTNRLMEQLNLGDNVTKVLKETVEIADTLRTSFNVNYSNNFRSTNSSNDLDANVEPTIEYQNITEHIIDIYRTNHLPNDGNISHTNLIQVNETKIIKGLYKTYVIKKEE